jgi:tRNA-splicing ligase RtcB (3'-phosphate/5'-hydroxy nucleic acid ligase)
MRSEGLIFADERIYADLQDDPSLEQVANVASLPGIVGPSLAMPDIHWGYGFPIGGVAAFAVHDGIVSPGGVGYDINCGVRLLRTGLDEAAVQKHLGRLVDRLFNEIPTGVGAHRRKHRLSPGDLRRVLLTGAEWVVRQGFGEQEDLDRIESGGRIEGADPDQVSERAGLRGLDQIGTLGSGNHFGEIGIVDEIYLPEAAHLFGLDRGAVTFMIHCGSRGLGYQVADDYMKSMAGAPARYGFDLPDRQLVCAPVRSPEGEQYLGAMRGAANYAFANRQMITHQARQVFSEVLAVSPRELDMRLVYDVCHNIAKIEQHRWQGKNVKVCVHRKGATRAFPAGHPEIPACYRLVGHPVLIPGDMGRYSYVLIGTEGAMAETWGSCCHGAGRLMSRSRARKQMRGRQVDEELRTRGIVVRAESSRVLAEESSEAYKDVADVVRVVEEAGLARRVARLRPIGNIKG